MKNYKTTISGAILLISGIVMFCIGMKAEGITAAVAGVGLLSAKDYDVTGGKREQ